MPELGVQFFAFANINNTIRLRKGQLLVRISDLLEGAPVSVLAALAHILLAKMYRRPIGREYAVRYRRYISSHGGASALSPPKAAPMTSTPCLTISTCAFFTDFWPVRA